MDKFVDQLSGICNVFAIYLLALNRAMKLNKKWKHPIMVYVLFEPHLFVPLHFSIIICLGLVDKYSKCWNKILKVIELVYNLSNTPLIFLNPLQSKFHNCIVVFTTYCPTIFQNNISCTLYMRDFCNRCGIYINCGFFFLFVPNFH